MPVCQRLLRMITRALKFTPDIKFVNDETLNEFVVTVERRDVGETDVKMIEIVTEKTEIKETKKTEITHCLRNI